MPLPHVLVLGAGFAGRRAEADLLASRRCSVTLVDAAPSFEYLPAALRCYVRPSLAQHTVVDHPRRLHRGRAVAAELAPEAAAPATLAALLLADGTRLPCDYLVCATGASFALPRASDQARRPHYAAVRRTLDAAPSVLVVGGGEVGVEAVAELAAAYGRSKRLTLLCSTPTLLPSLPPRAGAAAAAWLRAAGVTLHLGDRCADWGGARGGAGFEPGQHELTTAAGVVLAAACVIDATGGVPRAGYLAGTPGALTQKGALAVTPSLRVAPLRNVFAAGDVAQGVGANALAAEVSGALAAANVLRLMAADARARPATAAALEACCRPYTPPPRVALVSLGPAAGVAVLNRCAVASPLLDPLVAAAKWLIQAVQLGLARERWGFATLWRLMEAVTLFVGRHAFVEAAGGQAARRPGGGQAAGGRRPAAEAWTSAFLQ